MATDEKTYLKGEIARMKEAARNSEALRRELKEAIDQSRNVKGKKCLQDEMVRQENITRNLNYHVKELEADLKKVP
jgi:sensor c-di-GMP phosphodiesterase-like protein